MNRDTQVPGCCVTPDRSSKSKALSDVFLYIPAMSPCPTSCHVTGVKEASFLIIRISQGTRAWQSTRAGHVPGTHSWPQRRKSYLERQHQSWSSRTEVPLRNGTNAISYGRFARRCRKDATLESVSHEVCAAWLMSAIWLEGL